jgi:hypothetical protein
MSQSPATPTAFLTRIKFPRTFKASPASVTNTNHTTAVLQNDTESTTCCMSLAMERPDNFKDSEAEPLLGTSSSNYGTETESSTVKPTDSMPKRQIGVVSVVFIIFNKLIGTG